MYGLLVSGHVPIEKNAILNFLSEQVRVMTRKILQETEKHPRRVLEEVAQVQIRTRIEAGHSFLPNGLSAEDLEELTSENLRIQYRLSNPYAEVEAGHRAKVLPELNHPRK